MLQSLIVARQQRRIAGTLLLIMIVELIIPNVSYALSSGPVQPEISSFEPVGTTDMVDLFTGDFVYNVPLLDVEGYPINIAYHGGVGMEQEASWVGLGWNISPGAINRGVRGLPDEFAGDTIEKEIYLKPEISKKIGAEAGIELAGFGKPKLNIGLGLGGYVTISNYRGVGVDFTTSAGINTSFAFISAGMNIGASIGSQSGAAIDYGASVGVGISQKMNDATSANGTFNLNAGGVYSPRTGHRNSVGFNIGTSLREAGHRQATASMSTGTSVPIGLQNYTAAITNPSYMNSYSGQLKIGGELYSVYLNGKVSGSYSELKYNEQGSRKGFGYFHLDKGNKHDLLDFSREKDGMFNPTMHYLPQTSMTYDVYSVSGQGTGGSFRPFRNDIGSVYDPFTKSPQSSSETYSLEVGIGNLFEAGGEYTGTNTNVESGPWEDYRRPFKNDTTGYNEAIYFKEAGELTENNETYLNAYGLDNVVTPQEVANIPLTKPNAGKRIVRANHIFTHTGKASDTAALVDAKTLTSYTDSTGFATYPTVGKVSIARVDNDPSKKLKRNVHQLTEIVQTQKDGRRYIYGLPVLNNVQKEATFAINQGDQIDKTKYITGYRPGLDDKRANGNGLDHFYSSTVTPTYVTAHLLTGLLSKDYVDVTGNGISDDDLGTYTKFNYSKKSNDYRWRSPMEAGKAQYIPGYISDKKDDKASYLIGSREQWLLHSIETRNYVAEFYVSKREDAMGVRDTILRNGSVYKDALYSGLADDGERYSYKLDSIALFNKHDRFKNGSTATPIKTVFFTYDYSLCANVPNSSSGKGKLTLLKIQTKYGNSFLNMSAPYSFTYGSNYGYNIAGKDKWGSYKPNDPAFNNFEFPYTTQSSASDDYAKAWSLSEIALPSGGIIKVDYEADDYAYVQDQLAMEMFKIQGFGNSSLYRDKANQLYFSVAQQNLYAYFKRRIDAENPSISFRDNYLKGTNLIYFNVPVELADSKFEPVKAYAEVESVGKCTDTTYGYVKLVGRGLEGTNSKVNPIVQTALNMGRYNLPHILFPGSDPDATDMDNVAAGLKGAIKELWSLHKNPLKTMIEEGKAKEVQISKAYMRLTSPGLKKKGGGQRVKSIKFYDKWNAMSGGTQAIYGKTYDYTMKREDGQGVISSGVASYEPMIGGDENPVRVPVKYQVQQGSVFPPNDPIDLYQELPIGESFFPAPVVGYRRVTSRSINVDVGRSSQSEDVHCFYTARDFPIRTSQSGLKTPKRIKDVTMTNITFEQESTQGFAIVLNDMHGKQRATEHWVLKPAGGAGAKELVNSQQYEYMTSNGQLDNMVPAFAYDGPAGKLSVTKKKMGIESDLTIDSRMRYEESKKTQLSVSVNGFIVILVPVIFAIPFPFEFGNKLTFKCATVTKVTQQYGILDKVISNNQGAITTVKNEVFDPQTGNALVTSVNNQFGDREYSVSYPAHWAYKELGPSYENQDARGEFMNPLIIDSLGEYAQRFVNYNDGFSTRYHIPSNMPVARVMIDEEMGKFKLGDELLLQTYSSGVYSAPLRTWVMGYTSDTSHCYLVMANREPYKQSFTPITNGQTNVHYRVVRSGNKNRLGETIQTYTTTDSTNIFPYLKDSLTNLIALNAQTYKYNTNQVFARNTTSDSLNPFVTGKVGNYNVESQVINLKKREYPAGTTRNAGVFNSSAYWRTERDNYPSYCPDTIQRKGYAHDTVFYFPGYTPSNVPDILSSLKFKYLGGDSVEVRFEKYPTQIGTAYVVFAGLTGTQFLYGPNVHYILPQSLSTFPGFYQYSASFANTNAERIVIHDYFLTGGQYNLAHMPIYYYDGADRADFLVSFNPATHDFTITRKHYQIAGSSGQPVIYTNTYTYDPLHLQFNGTTIPARYDTISMQQGTTLPYRVRRKILLGKVGHYDYFMDYANWVKTQQVTKYNWFGAELENYEQGIGYNAAIYGYNQQLPVCVTKNAKHNEVLFEPFEDFDLLQPKPDKNESYMPLYYSPFGNLFGTTTFGSVYKTNNTTATVGSNTITRSSTEAHSGNHSLLTSGTATIFNLSGYGTDVADGFTFSMSKGRKYVGSIWVKPSGGTPNIRLLADTATLSTPSGVAINQAFTAKSNIIDGWQQYEITFTVPANYDYKRFSLSLSGSCYYDDLRIYPFESNSKGFVYHPVTRKLVATLDENNYTTFYEYDAEGNLVRTKKETDKGILTVSESRKGLHKL